MTLQDRAINQMIEKDESDGVKFICTNCGRDYLREGTLKNHIVKEHGALLTEIEESLTKADAERKKEFAIQAIEHFFTSNEKRYAKDLAEWQERFAKDPVHTFSWNTENFVKVKVIRDEAFQLSELYHRVPLAEFVTLVTEERERVMDELIQRPYTHRSTSLMSNAIEEWTHLAKCEFWGGRMFGDSVKGLIKYAKIALGEGGTQ